jgi:hypothetical protein
MDRLRGVIKMATSTESRSQQRFGASVSAIYSSFGTTNFRNAKIVNFSEDGLCIKADHPFPVGATIFLRVIDWQLGTFDRKPSSISLKTTATVEVKWCDKYIDSGQQAFLIGLKHYPPEY